MTPPLPPDRFPVTERWRYFDHAGVAPISGPAADAINWWADRWSRQGKVGYDEVTAMAEDVRTNAARLMHVSSTDVAFVKNTTEGLGFVANGLTLHEGDRVVVPDQEFPSTLLPWLALRDRGVRVDLVSPQGDGGALPVEAFAAVIDDGTPPKVVAFSWVQFARGWRSDLAAVTKLAHDAGALVCADIIQGLGVVPVDLVECDVDFAMSGTHKWLLGPEGVGVLYVAERVRDRLRPLEPGWASVAHQDDYDTFDPTLHDSARRFEGGSPNHAGILAFGASLELLLAAGVEAIWAWVDGLCDRLCAGVERIDGARVLSDRSQDGRSAIVTVAIDGTGSEPAAAALRDQGFVCGARGGGVRVAPHGYNDGDEIDALLDALSSLSRNGA